jgi:hypothetical protein
MKKVGELYKLKPQYLNKGFSAWENQLALYVGETVYSRGDGAKIVNLAFLLSGERRITDQSFWRCIEVASETW